MRFSYDAMVRMAWISTRYLLVEAINFGSVMGLMLCGCTEAKMAPIATPLLADIDKDTLILHLTLTKPQGARPARFPNLLVNGSWVLQGMATNIPPHNLGEIDGVVALIDNPIFL